MFDLRLVIGWFFVLNALTLVGTGLLQPVETMVAAQSINLNLCWGAVMFVFGLLMLLLSKLDSSKSDSPQSAAPEEAPPTTHNPPT